tara:strand:- start:96 stop:833 length:738 start_codon:yes stop_codon:yes gene_type:complete
MFFDEIFNKHIKRKKINYNLCYLKTVPSTNLYAWKHESELSHGTVIITKNQTRGMGRRGTEWFSSQNNSLTFSLIIKENKKYDKLLSLKTGISIIEGIKKYIKINCQLKWPNDIIAHNKKIGGILIERKKNKLVIGIGINVKENLKHIDPSIQNDTTSLKIISNLSIELEQLLANILNQFELIYYEINNEKIIQKWEKYCNHMNRNIKFHRNNIIINGIFKGLHKNGSAIIKNKKENIYISGSIY